MRDQTEMQKEVTAYSSQCMNIGRTRFCWWWCPSRDPNYGSIWPENSVSRSALFESPANSHINCGAHSTALPREDSKSSALSNCWAWLLSCPTRKSRHRCQAVAEHIQWHAWVGKQVSRCAQLLTKLSCPIWPGSRNSDSSWPQSPSCGTAQPQNPVYSLPNYRVQLMALPDCWVQSLAPPDQGAWIATLPNQGAQQPPAIPNCRVELGAPPDQGTWPLTLPNSRAQSTPAQWWNPVCGLI